MEPLSRKNRFLVLLGRWRHAINLFFWAVFVFSTYIVQQFQLQPWARLAIALIPILPLAGAIATYTMLVRNRCFDEFGRRILLEASAAVFIVGMPVLLLYAMLANAFPDFRTLTWQQVFVVAALLFVAGILRGLRKHQGSFSSRVGAAHE
jgi:hypothetical protein